MLPTRSRCRSANTIHRVQGPPSNHRDEQGHTESLRLRGLLTVMCPWPQMSEGRVVAVGPGRRSLNGDIIPVAVKEGDTVLLPEYGGTTVKLDSGNECAHCLLFVVCPLPMCVWCFAAVWPETCCVA